MLSLVVKITQLTEVIVTTVVFVIIGLIFFGLSFFILNKLTPFSIRKEIEEDQNIALGVVIGAMLIAIAIIIAAAISG
ncbi:MAG: DUF350 domain-containing protein [Acidobacteria bacterium]|nr:MAG: DUF350 domain-containing protein [Acidobacteriota bacterium]